MHSEEMLDITTYAADTGSGAEIFDGDTSSAYSSSNNECFIEAGSTEGFTTEVSKVRVFLARAKPTEQLYKGNLKLQGCDDTCTDLYTFEE